MNQRNIRLLRVDYIIYNVWRGVWRRRLRASQSAAAVAAGACSDAASSPFMAADSLSKRGRWTFLALQYRQSTFFSR